MQLNLPERSDSLIISEDTTSEVRSKFIWQKDAVGIVVRVIHKIGIQRLGFNRKDLQKLVNSVLIVILRHEQLSKARGRDVRYGFE